MTETFVDTISFNSVRYGVRFCPFFQFCAVRFTKPVVGRRSIWEIKGRTAHVKCRQHMIHILSALNAQAFVLRCGRTDFSCGSCVLKSCSYTPTIHMAPPRINFCPGPAGWLRLFGTDLRYAYWHMLYIYL